MEFKVLIVDDSNFFQHRLKEMLNEHPELKVVGIAANGREAVEKAASLKPDLITMDYEMPVMDGVTAVRKIMAERPVPILMFSSLTYEGARTTLDALEAGAVDFLPKNFAEISSDSATLKKKLHNRLLAIARQRRAPATAAGSIQSSPSSKSSALQRSVPTRPSSPAAPAKPEPRSLKGQVKLLLIGASTGGPVALSDVLTKLPANFPLPIVLIQHMPENFTKAFAERLNRQCKISVREAVDGDQLRPGLALLAPGGKQLMVDKRGAGCVRVLPGDERVNYKPSVDITFGSAANAYGGQSLGVILTGMGSDGCEGARLIKQKGGAIWSQDEASCVIYGMPMAVARARLTDRVLGLKDIGPALAKEL
ncbi:chemotaxis response regulator protein-glutamate methylesterase [Pseudomaricurvus alkylphenolicus]|jgi:two-component system chemotaxis response regulator CheB|uniref:protein-glutamate methylesterase/protein-glutamine glutaminase n=1 Tax=Pseudomaricurvus alkylphenolicus TaxID=1306991 RepID=UPI0014244726|nr:chemotaxis response regulator protein-glutamate methylesterase [Pseudomaricurvus alkylphenolicus]NIB43184.1 chemotaxis response regulator protein-glutamate methylesterase [Pseudomaricurvus alkylphenolicus]